MTDATHEHRHDREVAEPKRRPPAAYRVFACSCEDQIAVDAEGYPEDTRLPNPRFWT